MGILWPYQPNRPNRLLRVRWSITAGGVALLWLSWPVVGAQPTPSQTGSEAIVQSGKLAPKETREFPVSLANHEAVDIDLEQLGGQTFVDWIDPGGKESPFRFTQDGRLGHIRATVLADQAGTWRIRVGSRNRLPVEFSVQISVPRLQTTEDVRRAEAEDSLAKAEKIRLAMRAAMGNVIAEAEKPKLNDTQANAANAAKAYDGAITGFHDLRDGCRARMALNGLGHFQIQIGQYDPARATAQLALGEGCADPPSRAHSLRILQSALEWLGDLDGTISTGEEALKIYKETGDLAFEGLILGNLSSAYDQEGATGKGLETIRQALDLARQTGDREGVVFDEETMGAIYLQRGEYQQAFDAFARTLEDLKAFPDSDVEGMVETDLASVYSALGDEESALESFRHAQETARTHANPSILVDSLTDQGRHYLSLRQYKQAAETLQSAIAVIDEKKITQKRAKAERGLGAAEIGEGHIEAGLKLLLDSRELARSLRDDFTEIEADLSLGDYYAGQGDFAKSEDAYKLARDLAQHSNTAPQSAIALASLAHESFSQHDLVSARGYAESALSIIEDESSQVNAPDLQSRFFQSTRGYYDLDIQILMGLEEKTHDDGYARAALEVAESARARALTDLLSTRAIAIHNAIPAELLRQRTDAEDGLHAVAFRLARLKASDSKEERSALETGLAAAKSKLDQAEGNIRRANRRYSDLVHPEHLTVDEIQRNLLDDNSVLLEYWLSEKQSYLWELTSQQMRCYRLPSAKKLESLASRFRSLLASGEELPAGISIEQKSKYVEKGAEEIASLSGDVGRLLLGPVAVRLGRRSVVIVADGSLRGIPFGLLPLSPSLTLEQRNRLTYLPSIGALRWLRTGPFRDSTAHRLAVFADPVFDSHDARLSAKLDDAHVEDSTMARALRDASTQKLSRLAWSRREALSVAGYLPKENTWVALDFEANRNSALGASWQQFDFAHFATHALIDSRNPELSGIVLSLYDKQGKPVDGFLRVTDIYNLSIPAQLVVLSTCDSAADSAAMGNDVYTLADAFFYAGTPRLVASLWTVNDHAASVFMDLFYRALLLHHATPAAALQSAKNAMARNLRWHSPFYWSGFVLEGDWR